MPPCLFRRNCRLLFYINYNKKGKLIKITIDQLRYLTTPNIFVIVVAVDLLGRTIHRRRHRRRLPPVRPEGQRHQARLVRLLRQELDRPVAAIILDDRSH